MHLLRNTFVAIAVVLLAVSDASETKISAMTSSDSVLPTRSLVDGDSASERFLRGNNGKEVATGDEDDEERLWVPSLLKNVADEMATVLFRVLRRFGNTPGRLAERLNIGSPGTPRIYNKLYEKYTAWYGAQTAAAMG